MKNQDQQMMKDFLNHANSSNIWKLKKFNGTINQKNVILNQLQFIMGRK